MPTKITFPSDFCESSPLADFSTDSYSTVINDLNQYKTEHLRFEQKKSNPNGLKNPAIELASYANFLPEAIQAFLNLNAGAKFIRIFNGVRDNGTHYMFMTAVDGDEMVKNTVVLENCCQCPPRCKPSGGFQ